MEVALMQYLNIRQNIVVPNVYWGIDGLNYECDLVKVTPSGFATEIEIKVSKNDLIRDRHKKHNHSSKLFKYVYFAVPEHLSEIALQEIPDKAGLLTVQKVLNCHDEEYFNVLMKRQAKLNTNHIKWSVEQRQKLTDLGCMRIFGLKRKLLDYMLICRNL